MKVLITGGAGFVGSEFNKLGIDVQIIDNMEYGYEDNIVDCPHIYIIL